MRSLTRVNLKPWTSVERWACLFVVVLSIANLVFVVLTFSRS